MPTITTPSKADRRLESIPNAAEYIGVSTKTIRRYIAAGRAVGYRAGPRLIRVDLNDLDAMLRAIPAGGRQHACKRRGPAARTQHHRTGRMPREPMR